MTGGWRPDIAAEEVPKAIEAHGLRPVASYFGAIGETEVDRVDLTAHLKAVWGEYWYLNQGECGSCVAFGAALACDVLTALEIVANRRRKPRWRTDPMSIYWGSRVEIGRGQIRGQGSVGVWAAEYLQKFGALEQRKYPSIDLRKYNPSLCCGPNASRGVPDDLEPIARNHPVRAFAQVKSFAEAVTALANGFPVTIASRQGFSMRLNAEGFGSTSGSWNHQQCVVGFELTPKPCLWIANSWGPCYSGGPPGWCPAVMKVRQSTAEYMLADGDSWALSSFETFAPKELDLSPINF